MSRRAIDLEFAKAGHPIVQIYLATRISSTQGTQAVL